MSYIIIDCDGDIVRDEVGSVTDCLQYLNLEDNFKYGPYSLFSDSSIKIKSRQDIEKLINSIEHIDRTNRQNVQEFVNDSLGIEAPKIKKFVVITKGYHNCGSYDTEEEALESVKEMVKGGSLERFIILEAKKEAGVTTPEMEIEEL